MFDDELEGHGFIREIKAMSITSKQLQGMTIERFGKLGWGYHDRVPRHLYEGLNEDIMYDNPFFTKAYFHNGRGNVIVELPLEEAQLITLEFEIEKYKASIKYHTLKARYQRMFLGGDVDAIPTKRYVKKLKQQLKDLEAKKEELTK